MKNLLFTLLGAVFGLIGAQDFSKTPFNSLTHNRIYHIDIGDNQTVELIQLQNKKVSGSVVNRTWSTKDGNKKLVLYAQKIPLDSEVAGKIMNQLISHNFEDLKDCKEVTKCAINPSASQISFSFQDFKNDKKATYYDLKSNEIYSQNGVVIPSEVIKARMLLSIINLELGLERNYQVFLSQLPKGKYISEKSIYVKK